MDEMEISWMKKYQKWFENVEIQKKNLIKISAWYVWINVEPWVWDFWKQWKKRREIWILSLFTKGAPEACKHIKFNRFDLGSNKAWIFANDGDKVPPTIIPPFYTPPCLHNSL